MKQCFCIQCMCKLQACSGIVLVPYSDAIYHFTVLLNDFTSFFATIATAIQSRMSIRIHMCMCFKYCFMYFKDFTQVTITEDGETDGKEICTKLF